jgi:glycerate dehydrogenase
MKIVILDDYTVVQDDLNWNGLKDLGELIHYRRTADDQVIQRITDAEIVITSKCIINQEVMDSAPNLKYIGVTATGYNNIDSAYANYKGITVTNIPAYSTDSVAQFTFALILETANHVGLYNQSVRKGDWFKSLDFTYSLTPQMELTGKTIGIIGYGNIGKKVSCYANAFGLNVLVYSSHMLSSIPSSSKTTDSPSIKSTDSKSTDNNDYGVKFVNLEELLASSDIISLNCALTKENEKIINSSTISKMKNGAVIINTSRGPLINEDDLGEALERGKISWAALDVMALEPPKPDNPLLNIKNCLITPHVAWDTTESRTRLVDSVVNNLKAYLNDETINQVK